MFGRRFQDFCKKTEKTGQEKGGEDRRVEGRKVENSVDHDPCSLCKGSELR